MRRVCVLLLLAVGHCVKSQTLTQPGSVTVQPGRALSIPCDISHTGYWTAWIRQPAGKAMEYIGYHCAACTLVITGSLKNKFSIDHSSKTRVILNGQNMQPEDSAVYYCARHWSGSYGAFDYWGKGTMVTVTSATPHAPSVFPVMPCASDSAEITLACLATGFSPSAVTFSWSVNGTDIADSLQYPSVLKNDLYSGVSQIRVRRQDWDERLPYKCKVVHQEGTREVDFIKPLETYELPSLKVMTTEDNRKLTLSCLANNFVPNIYEFKWLKSDGEIVDSSLQFTTDSKPQKWDNGTRYSAASFLTLPSEELRDDSKLMCIFNLGRGRKQMPVNTTYLYRPSNLCTGSGSDSSDDTMSITPPSLYDMLYERKGKLRCEVSVKDPSKVIDVYWLNEDREVLMNKTDRKAEVRGGRYVLPLDITYEEWNLGIKRTCFMEHDDYMEGRSEVYVRNNDVSSQTPPSVFMLTPLKQTRDDKVTLTCFIKDFYPKEIYVTWLIDDKRAGYDFSTTNSVRSNGAYYAYSYLTVPMSVWEVPEKVFSCLVYHESLEKNQNIVRSIMQHSSEQTTMVNLNMKLPDVCKG